MAAVGIYDCAAVVVVVVAVSSFPVTAFATPTTASATDPATFDAVSPAYACGK